MTRIIAKDLFLRFPIVLQKKSFRNLFSMRQDTSSSRGPDANPLRGTLNVTALNGLSFEFKDGDRVGLIGHNGAGKSTLLKTLAGIYTPNSGSLEITGKVETLIDVSFGIDQDETGIDNIRFVLELMGVQGKKLGSMCDEIADFTELAEKLYLPVRTYSSGMQTRLAFAISTALDPEILLIDEVIGTGDASFFEKAKARVENLRDKTRIMVLATHSTTLMREWCDKALWLENGSIKMHGPVGELLDQYDYEMKKP